MTEDEPAVDGEDIVISLDIGMQQYLEERLVLTAEELEGKGGNSLIYDGGTGEIYACASLPYLDPSDREHSRKARPSCAPLRRHSSPAPSSRR